jgi:hypothetical protein
MIRLLHTFKVVGDSVDDTNFSLLQSLGQAEHLAPLAHPGRREVEHPQTDDPNDSLPELA